MSTTLGGDDVRVRLLAVCELMLENTELLTKADQATGDGDHGVTMARGFRAARDALLNQTSTTPGQAFRVVGTTLMSTCGGASGAVFGTLFRSTAREMTASELDAETFVRALTSGMEAVMKRGGAALGDKTMIDALAPALESARRATESGIEPTLAAAAQGAVQGVEATMSMVAKIGKAKTLGERSLDHPDPGALSMSFILKGLQQDKTPG